LGDSTQLEAISGKIDRLNGRGVPSRMSAVAKVRYRKMFEYGLA